MLRHAGRDRNLASTIIISIISSSLHPRVQTLVSTCPYLRPLPLPHKHRSPLHCPDPIRQRAVQRKIRQHGPERVGFGRVPAELVVAVEGDGGDDNGGIAEGQADVGQEVGLFEFEGGEVVGEGVVGGVFEVCAGEVLVGKGEVVGWDGGLGKGTRERVDCDFRGGHAEGCCLCCRCNCGQRLFRSMHYWD